MGPALQALLADVLSGREPGLVVAAALGAFARVLLQNGAAFLSLFQAAAAAGVAPPPDAPPAADPAQRLLLALVDLWLDKFDSIGRPGARKLSALALCVLLAAPVPQLLERLQLIVAHVTSVWFEVREAKAARARARARARPCIEAPCLPRPLLLLRWRAPTWLAPLTLLTTCWGGGAAWRRPSGR